MRINNVIPVEAGISRSPIRSGMTIFIAIASLILLYPNSVFAHVLKTDGSIGAVLHIDPEDDPIIGQPSFFFFEFKDTQKKFQLNQCKCQISINRSGTLIHTETLIDSSSFSFTFPNPNIYTIKVTGQPHIPNQFQQFSLEYPLRVSRQAAVTPTKNWFSSNISYIAGLFIFASLVVIVTNQIILNRRQNRK